MTTAVTRIPVEKAADLTLSDYKTVFLGNVRVLPMRSIHYYKALFPKETQLTLEKEKESSTTKKISILVKKPDLQYTALELDAENTTVAELILRVRQLLRLSSHYRFIYQGTPLLESSQKTLEKQGFQNGLTLQTILNLRGGGGGFKFADLEKNATQTLDFSEKAPWYRSAEPGLCIEGKCTNKDCAAEGCMVISNHRFGQFDLTLDAQNVLCPVCMRQIEPITCGFNRCQWRWKGLKYDSESEPGEEEQKSKPMEWTVTKENYFRFDETKCGSAYWRYLFIETIPVEKTADCFYWQNYVRLV